ncbi:MAG: YlxR family protein [Myxococcota bacterium]
MPSVKTHTATTCAARAPDPTATGPIRTCVGCRSRAPQSDLVRIAAAGGRMRLDPRRHIAGRGAYVHRDMVCVERATRRGALPRALRITHDPVSCGELRRLLAALIDSKIDSNDSLMNQITAPTPIHHVERHPQPRLSEPPVRRSYGSFRKHQQPGGQG